MNLDHILSFFTKKLPGWVNLLRALLSAIFCKVWGLCFPPSVGKLRINTCTSRETPPKVPDCGPSSISVEGNDPFVGRNLLFCSLPVFKLAKVSDVWIQCGKTVSS